MQLTVERLDGALVSHAEVGGVFQRRVGEISGLLSCGSVRDMWDGLPSSPRHLDLFTGTGAGIVAVSGSLSAVRKAPSVTVGVDKFGIKPLGHIPFAASVYRRSGYSLSKAETESNVSTIAGDVLIVPADALAYVGSFSETASPFPFDLVTGFSLPVHGTVPEEIVDFLSLVSSIDSYKVPTLFTFAKRSSYQMVNLQAGLDVAGLSSGWRIYRKPLGLGDSDWDCWILTNCGEVKWSDWDSNPEHPA